MTNGIRFGFSMWAQATTWAEILATAQHCDAAGFDHVWVYDHLLGIVGDPQQPNLEGWTTLAGLAAATTRTRLGLLVGSNTYRNPGLVAKMVTTIDHISGGRAILGIGSGWAEREHQAYGFAFGSGFGERLRWLDEASGVMRRLLHGETVSHHSETYAFDGLALSPAPIQARLPIMIGGAGEQKTLRIIARDADMWNLWAEPADLRRKDEILVRYCEEIGRDPSEIERTLTTKIIIRDSVDEARRVWERQKANIGAPADWKGTHWLGTPEQIAERLAEYVAIGVRTFIPEGPAPYDLETASRLIDQVKQLLTQETTPAG